MLTDKQTLKTFSEIRSALAEIDNQRKDKTLSDTERELLELSAVRLREAERQLIEAKEKNIITGLDSSIKNLSTLTKEIRESVARMNKTVRTLDSIENVIKQLVKILSYTHNFVK